MTVTLSPIAEPLRNVMAATGYLAHDGPARGVRLEREIRNEFRDPEARPDALWCSESNLTVCFKAAEASPAPEQVAWWHRAVWNYGFAPLLWVVSPHSINLYNGFSRPHDSTDANRHRLFNTFDIRSDLKKLDDYAGRLAMETGQFWQNAPEVDRKTSVDRQLLTDLRYLEESLISKGLRQLSAQSLIGRAIFTQYLIDRQIIGKQDLEQHSGHSSLSDILRHPSATKRLFLWLRHTFNGDMFKADDNAGIGESHLESVAKFLDGTDPKTGQLSFFPYQFDVIPIQLISAIYEQFAQATDDSGDYSQTADVYYTPAPLVSLVVDEITEEMNGDETVVDFTCGSGVFLVELLKKLVQLRSGHNPPDRNLIRSVLYKQIYGMDNSEAAIRIASFSLYLAALDLDSTPRITKDCRFKPLIGRNLIIGDALNIEQDRDGKSLPIRPFWPKYFDAIVGNPPWSYRRKSANAQRSRSSRSGTPRSPRGVSFDFIRSAMTRASDNTKYGLVLSGSVFFARSDTGVKAVSDLIDNLLPVTLVDLSRHSSWLFSNASWPAMVMFAKHRTTRNTGITVVQVPWSIAGPRSHTLEIGHNDIVSLPAKARRQYPQMLKAAFFGSPRDMALLDNLTLSYVCLREQLHEIGTDIRSGLTKGNASQDSSFLNSLPLVTKDRLRPFSIDPDLGIYKERFAERPRGRDIYRAPVLLVDRRFRKQPRTVAAVSDKDVVFMNSLCGISLPRNHADIGNLLAAVLSSSLFSWFLLMTGSEFGLSMNSITLRDIASLPLPPLQSVAASKPGKDLIALVRGLRLRSDPPDAEDWKRLDEAVFDIYELDAVDRIVVGDGLYRAKWQWRQGREDSISPATITQDMPEYVRSFLSVADSWIVDTQNQSNLMRGEIYDFRSAGPLHAVRFVLEESNDSARPRIMTRRESRHDVLNKIADQLGVSVRRPLAGNRELRIYGDKEVIIVKPAARRHWMRICGLNDADTVIKETLSGALQ